MITKVFRAMQSTPTILKIVRSQLTCAHNKQVTVPCSYPLVAPTAAGEQMSHILNNLLLCKVNFCDNNHRFRFKAGSKIYRHTN